MSDEPDHIDIGAFKLALPEDVEYHRCPKCGNDFIGLDTADPAIIHWYCAYCDWIGMETEPGGVVSIAEVSRKGAEIRQKLGLPPRDEDTD